MSEFTCPKSGQAESYHRYTTYIGEKVCRWCGFSKEYIEAHEYLAMAEGRASMPGNLTASECIRRAEDLLRKAPESYRR